MEGLDQALLPGGSPFPGFAVLGADSSSSLLYEVTLSQPMAPCYPTTSDDGWASPCPRVHLGCRDLPQAGPGTLMASSTCRSSSWTQKPVISSRNCR